MKLLILPKYSRRAASYRYRFEQYLPHLRAHGIECDVSPLFDDAYLDERMQSGRLGAAHLARAFFRRAAAAMRAGKYDLIWLHLEALPYAPALIERSFVWRGVPYVFDFDDAIFHQYDRHRSPLVRAVLGRKTEAAIAGAARVFAGNEYLRDYSLRFNSRVTVVPTSVDLRVYRPRPAATRGPSFTIGWIGSPSTAPYLRVIEKPLRAFARAHPDAKFVAVGAGPFAMEGVPWEIREWNEEREAEDVRGFDVGVMPLDGAPWSRGKCGFKIIQCLASGTPTIASPVGVNSELIENGQNGYLASSDDEWLAAFEALYRDRARLPEMGESGRRLIAARFSLDAQAPRILDGLLSSAPTWAHAPA